jgi:P-type Cu+ transporter
MMRHDHDHNHTHGRGLAEHELAVEVRDPVCGMMIQPEDAVGTAVHNGVTYHFCNPTCLTKFKADPERYVEPQKKSSAPAGEGKVEYTCPMHPEVKQFGPGSCPKCGMALEPATVTAEEDNHELRDMTRRFWVSLVLTLPILALMISEMLPGKPLQTLLGANAVIWVQFILATPVVLWGGAPFFERGWRSVLNATGTCLL